MRTIQTSKAPCDVPTVGVYLRVSTKEQANTGDSIDTQRKLCLAHLEAVFGPGGCVVREYVDEGKSGTYGPHPYDLAASGRKTRKGLCAMLTAAVNGEIEAVCFLAIDRLYRNETYWRMFRAWCKERDIRVLSVTEAIADDETEEFGSNILASFAQHQRDCARKRSLMTIDKRRGEGYWLGVAPYGFEYEPRDEPSDLRRRNIRPVPARLDVVARVFALHDQGLAPPRIAARLNSEGAAFEAGKKGPWYAIRVLNILKCGAYAGLVRGKEGDWRPGLHAECRIMEREEWEAHLSRIDRRRTGLKGRIGAEPERLFARLLRCGVCGRNLCSRYDSPYPFYECRRGNEVRTDGTRVHVSASAASLEAVVVSEIARVARDPAVLAEAKRRAEDLVSVATKEMESDRRSAADRVSTARKRIENLEDRLADGQIPVEQYRRMVARYEAEAREAAEESAEGRSAALRAATAEEQVKRTIALLGRFEEAWGKLTLVQRRDLLQDVVEFARVLPLAEGRRVLELKILGLPATRLDLPAKRARFDYGRTDGPEGLTARQLALIAHLEDGRTFREAAALMEVRISQAYRLRRQIEDHLGMTLAEARTVSRDLALRLRPVLPLHGSESDRRHLRRLRTLEWQVLHLVSSGLAPAEIAKKHSLPVDVVEARLASALKKTGESDAGAAIETAKRLGLASARKEWQWGTRKRIEGGKRERSKKKR